MNLKKAYNLLKYVKKNNKNLSLQKTCKICKLKITCNFCKFYGPAEGQKWYEQSKIYLSD